MENTTIIDYCGDIRYETIGELIHNFKQQVPLIGIPMKIYKRLLLIMIESLENIMKHAEIPTGNTGWNVLPSLSIKVSDNRFMVRSSNLLTAEHASTLRARIDFLNNLDQQGIKNFYKETITNGIFTKSGGAGLGLIEIAKISGNPVSYEFKPMDNGYFLYVQYVTVDAK